MYNSSKFIWQFVKLSQGSRASLIARTCSTRPRHNNLLNTL